MGSGRCVRCAERFPNCKRCSATACLECNTDFYLFLLNNGVNSDDCDSCDAPDRYKNSIFTKYFAPFSPHDLD